MMYAHELLKQLQAELEQDLADRRIKNDSRSLNWDDTMELRGEVKYIKTILSKFRDRISEGNL